MQNIAVCFSTKRIFVFLSIFLSLTIFNNANAQGTPAVNQAENKYTTIKLKTTDTNAAVIKKLKHSLDSFYKHEIATGFNGSVLVGYKGKILYERYLGYANLKKQIKLSPNTPSQLASTSKPFLATAVLWLHENKYLDINLPVRTYLPNFPYADITIKMLLNHRSGLPEYLNFASKYWGTNTLKSNGELVDLFAKSKPRLTYKPGARFHYCNSNYAILARVVEEVTEKTFPVFMKEFIFGPLGMHHTFVYDPIQHNYENRNLTISYQKNWVAYPDMFADGIYGDKNIYSTVRDLYIWDQSFYHHVLISEKTLKMAYTGYSNEMPGEKNYGLGWRMMDFPDGYKVIFHNGWWHGNNIVFYRFVKDNFTIIVLGNRYNNKIYDQAKAVYDITQNVAQSK